MTLVLDTSVVVPALTDGGTSGDAVRSTLDTDEELICPALLDTEVAHALRGRVKGGRLQHDIAARAIAELRELPIRRYDAVPLLPRIWQLRDNLTAYDATYVALAEIFDAVLITGDVRLSRASGPRCDFLVLPVGG